MTRYRFLISLICSLICQIAFSAQIDGERVMRYDDRDGLSSPLVGGGIQDRNGLLWFATWNGLNCYDGYEFHWVKIAPGDFNRDKPHTRHSLVGHRQHNMPHRR